jgi:hypothetical protein
MRQGCCLSLGIFIGFNRVTGHSRVRLDGQRLRPGRATRYLKEFGLQFILVPTIVRPTTLTDALAQGFFNAYGGPVRRDSVDYVLHLGDYIYEHAEGECKETKLKS